MTWTTEPIDPAMLAVLAQDLRWLEQRRRGRTVVTLARRAGTTVRAVTEAVERALRYEAAGESMAADRVVVAAQDATGPVILTPLSHLGGLVHREDVCPRHPGLRLIAPGLVGLHPNPLHHKWARSNLVCLACFRTPQDYRLRRDLHTDPKPDPKPAATGDGLAGGLAGKRTTQLTRRQRRAIAYGSGK